MREAAPDAPPGPRELDREATRARRELFLYFVLLVLGSALFEELLLRSGDSIDAHPLVVVALMWTPGLASITTRLALRSGFRDVSFRLAFGR